MRNIIKKTMTGTMVLLYIAACSTTKQNITNQAEETPPGWVSPTQPCPDRYCAIPVNPHVENIYDTKYVCIDCSDLKKVGMSDNTSNCPSDMVEIDGDYCPVVQQRCLYMVDSHGKRTNEAPDPNGRCGEWANPVKCVSNKIHKHYCIDKYELPNKEGVVPSDWLSWYDVKDACESEGKRMCTRSEWTFAAEGPNMHPYSYGDGFHRDRDYCNFDNHLAFMAPTIKRANGKLTAPTGDDVMKVSNPNSDIGKALRSLLVPSGNMKPGNDEQIRQRRAPSSDACKNDWGVYDMPGNVDEWVVNETGKPYVSGLMGGHVFGVRNASRPMTDAHGPNFKWYETGGRCCADAK